MIQLPDFITEKVDDLVEFVQEKKQVALSCIILVFLTICAFIVFSVHTCTISELEKKTVPAEPVENLSFAPDQPVVLPDGPAMPDGYALSRNPKPHWNDDEIQENFTVPDENNLEDLKKANDALINEVLGAAP